jgi:hypothetical protein
VFNLLTTFTLESEPEVDFDSDAMLDEPDECDQIGVKTECYHQDGKVTKEILEVSFIHTFKTVTDFCHLDWRREKEADSGSFVHRQVHSLLL